MQLILVPTDFSSQARNALTHACQIAKTFNAKIILLHAYMLPTPVSEVPYVMVTVDELQKENENLIKKEAENVLAEFGVETEWIVRIGIPSDEIKAITEERDIDLVVMGMKGVGGLDKIIGSTTTNAISKLKTPVMIIPQDARFRPLKKISFATDLHYEILPKNFKPLTELASAYNASLQILYVHRKNDAPRVDELEWRRTVEQYFSSIEHEFFTVEDSSVMHGINSFIEQHSSELLVMIAHKHTFLERIFNRSQTRAMAYETRIPLLVLQTK